MDLNSLKLDELKEIMLKYNAKAFRANQIYNFFHKQGRVDLENSNLPKDLVKSLRDNETIGAAKIVETYESKIDDTKKFLFKLNDGNIIEGVLMKYHHGYSQCISTQVGCRMGCLFCASTKGGLVRNLETSEILSQVYEVENKYNINVSNLIIMGCGEPLDNFDNLIRFLEIIHSEGGKNISYRNITVSTCVVVDKIYELGKINLPITLAISLHNTDNKSRDELMPINKKYNIENLIKSCKDYSNMTGSRITFEYTLISGQNDSNKNVEELVKLLKGFKNHINLIPLNPIEEYEKERPSLKDVKAFKKKLESNNLNVTIRRELGQDIKASCGQLRRNYEGGGNVEIFRRNK